MAKAQQKAKAKIRWAQHKQEQFLESPFFAELVVPAQEQRAEMCERGFMQTNEAEQRMYDQAGKHGTELGELDARIEELEAELKYEERKYFEAMGVWHDGRDVGKLTTNLRQLLDIKKENEAEIAKLESTVGRSEGRVGLQTG